MSMEGMTIDELIERLEAARDIVGHGHAEVMVNNKQITYVRVQSPINRGRSVRIEAEEE